MVDVVVVGSLVIDFVSRVERRPALGETVTAEEFGIFLGGKGFNQAVAACRAGASVSLIGMLGDDLFAPLFEDALDREGIDRRGVERGGEGTGVSTPIVDRTGQNTLVVAPRSNLALTAAEVRAKNVVFQSARVVVSQRETSAESILETARLAREHGLPFVFNAAPAGPLDPEIFPLIDVLVVNESEAEAFSGIRVQTDDNAIAAAHTLQQRGPRSVIVTLGERGSFVLGESVRERIAAITVIAVDATGAGDAFVGALATRLAAGDPLVAAARFGNVAGGLAVTRLGAEPSLPRRADIFARLDQATSG